MISTALTTVFTIFGIFRTVYNQDASAIIMSIVNLIWAWQYLVFLIASIFSADSTTRTVSILFHVRENLENFIGPICGWSLRGW